MCDSLPRHLIYPDNFSLHQIIEAWIVPVILYELLIKNRIKCVLVPTMEFTYTEMVVKESDKMVQVPIRRRGDATQNSSVICYTRQNTAAVMMDFDERLLTEASRITFLPGEQVLR